MRIFSFSLHPVFKFPWEIFLFLSFSAALFGVVTRSLDTSLPALAGILIFSIFFAIKRFSFIKVTDRSVIVRLGPLAYGEIDISNVIDISVVNHEIQSGIGVRVCGKGETAIVTKTGDVVRLQLKEKGTIRMCGLVKISFSALRISPVRQNEFIDLVKSYMKPQ
jgi:hypothetical protein